MHCTAPRATLHMPVTHSRPEMLSPVPLHTAVLPSPPWMLVSLKTWFGVSPPWGSLSSMPPAPSSIVTCHPVTTTTCISFALFVGRCSSVWSIPPPFPSLLSSLTSSLASHQPDMCPSRVSPSLTTWADAAVLAWDLLKAQFVHWWPVEELNICW